MIRRKIGAFFHALANAMAYNKACDDGFIVSSPHGGFDNIAFPACPVRHGDPATFGQSRECQQLKRRNKKWARKRGSADPVSMIVVCCLMLMALLALNGCTAPGNRPAPAPAPGSVSIQRTTTEPGGTVKEERITYTTPELADGPGALEVGDVKASFAKGRDPIIPEIKDVWPQRMLYAVGVVCILLAGGLIGVGQHFKLGTIAGICGGCIIALAQFLEHFGLQVALFTGMGILGAGCFVGFYLWKDYKADGRIDALNPSTRHDTAK